MSVVYAIDPGNVNSAFCVIDTEDLKPTDFGIVSNEELSATLNKTDFRRDSALVIEMIASYGMPVGKEVFDTCRWIGRFEEIYQSQTGEYPPVIYRKEEKLHLCENLRAKDANIRRALIDRFAKHDLKNGRGTKKNPDWFYGFKADVWAAYAVGVTYIETKMNERN